MESRAISEKKYFAAAANSSPFMASILSFNEMSNTGINRGKLKIAKRVKLLPDFEAMAAINDKTAARPSAPGMR